MRAARVTRLDGPGAIEVAEVEEPQGDGVVVDVHAAGVAFPDALLTRGLYQYRPEPPFVLGAGIAGVVRSAPEGSHVRAGDRVVGLTMLSGGMAEVAMLAPDRVFRLPDHVGFEAGSGLLVNDLTVYFALTVRGRLAQGETVLVHGAAGGIGTSALRLAAGLGAAGAIAVVSTPEKSEIATAAGATDVVLADGFKNAVKELTAGRGVDVVGVGWGAWIGTHPDALAEQWAGLEVLLSSGRLTPPEPVVYPLDGAATPVASLENRTATGKVVLRVRD